MKSTKRSRSLKKVQAIKKENHKLREKVDERKDYDQLYTELVARRRVNHTDDAIITKLQKERDALKATIKEREALIDRLVDQYVTTIDMTSDVNLEGVE